MIRNLLHTCTIYRRQQIAGKGLSSAYQPIATKIRCLAIPQTAEDNIQQNITFGKDYVVFFDDNIDIKESDKLEVSTGVLLTVSGVASYLNVPNVSHKEANCQTVEKI